MGTNKIRLDAALKIEQLVKELINHPDKRVIIEVMEDGSVLKNEVNLRLLKFYADEEEKELIIQANDPGLLSLAQRLGISTLKEVELDINMSDRGLFPETDSEVAATPEFEKPVKGDVSRRWGEWATAILIIVFTLGLALWWFFQPKAVVTVFPKFQEISFVAKAKIGNTFKDEDILHNELPAKVLVKEADIPVQTITSGKKMVGFTKATGKVLLINNTNQPVVLPQGTILTSQTGIGFLTDQEVLIPRKSAKMESGIEVGTVYGKAGVEITAEKKGVAGNLPAKSITRIESKYQRFIKVTNPVPTMNGADKSVAVVTLEDIKKGEDEARRQMQLVGPEVIKTSIGEEYLYLPDLEKLEVLKISYDQNIGSESDVLQTDLEYRITVLVPLWAGINKFLTKQLECNLPPYFQATGQKVELVSANVITSGDEWSELNIEGKGKIRGVLNPKEIKKLIKGKTLEEAQTILLTRNEIAGAKISIAGSGSKLPGYGFQIRVLLPDGAGPR